MRRIALVTSGRQDWGILRSIARRLRDSSEFDLVLMIGGMHLHPQFGETASLVLRDGFENAVMLDWLGRGEIPDAASQSARSLEMVFNALREAKPEAVILVGDRFETLSAAQAAVLARVPIVHLHGGEESEGALDNSFRHAVSKLSHLHLVSHPSYRDRLLKMGEAPAAIHVVGAAGLDNVHRSDLMARAELESFLGGELSCPVVLVTYHPATLATDTIAEAQALLDAMDAVPATYIVSAPNSDTEGDRLRGMFEAACVGRPRRFFVPALGEQRFWSLLRLADAMLGNSSSGLIEASAVALPVVNIGVRQQGRLRTENVVDVLEPTPATVAAALHLVLAPSFRASLIELVPPFGDGHAAERIEDILSRWQPPVPPMKLGVAS